MSLVWGLGHSSARFPISGELRGEIHGVRRGRFTAGGRPLPAVALEMLWDVRSTINSCKKKVTFRLANLLKSPCSILESTRHPWRLLRNTLCCVKNVNRLGLIQNALSDIYKFATDFIMLIKCSFSFRFDPFKLR
jgi:hypothetical protein